jgi:hypothetical protein
MANQNPGESPMRNDVNLEHMDGIDEAVESISPAQESSLNMEAILLRNPEKVKSSAKTLRELDKLANKEGSGFDQAWEDMNPVELGLAIGKLSFDEYGMLLWHVKSIEGHQQDQKAA